MKQKTSILRYPAHIYLHFLPWRGKSWSFPLSAERYFVSRRKHRNPFNGGENYRKFVTSDEKTLVFIMNEIGSWYLGRNWRDKKKELANLVVEFVHRIPYQEREMFNYVKYPLETLCEHCGNCVDLCVLGASLLTIGGIESCFFVWKDHIALGIASPGRGKYREINGKKYYAAEMTGTFEIHQPSRSGIGEMGKNLNRADVQLTRDLHF